MAAHSRVLAWRIPGMAEPGWLPSKGSHRVGHDWSDLAAAAAAVQCILLVHQPWSHSQQQYNSHLNKACLTHICPVKHITSFSLGPLDSSLALCLRAILNGKITIKKHTKAFSASIETITLFLSFNLLIWCITLIDLWILKNPTQKCENCGTEQTMKRKLVQYKSSVTYSTSAWNVCFLPLLMSVNDHDTAQGLIWGTQWILESWWICKYESMDNEDGLCPCSISSSEIMRFMAQILVLGGLPFRCF